MESVMKVSKRPNGPKGTKTIAAEAWLDGLAERIWRHGLVTLVLKANGRINREDLIEWVSRHEFMMGDTNSGTTYIILNAECDEKREDRLAMERRIEDEIARKAIVTKFLSDMTDLVRKMGAAKFTPIPEVHDVDLINWRTQTGFTMEMVGECLVVGVRRQAA
jgi:hypothetical protein